MLLYTGVIIGIIEIMSFTGIIILYTSFIILNKWQVHFSKVFIFSLFTVALKLLTADKLVSHLGHGVVDWTLQVYCDSVTSDVEWMSNS